MLHTVNRCKGLCRNLKFELPSFYSARHQNRNAASKKKVSPLDFQQLNHLKRMLALESKERAFLETKMSSLISGGHIGGPKLSTNMAFPYKGLQRCMKAFRQMTQNLWATNTWNLDKLFILFITFHFLGFFHWTVSNLFFCALFIAWQWKRRITQRKCT